MAKVSDRYDWDYSEYIKVPKPDFGKDIKGTIAPSLKTIIVYHSNAKRLEDAKLAAPYNLRSKPWYINNAKLMASAIVEQKL